MQEKCKSCLFYNPIGESEGFCHFNPPKVISRPRRAGDLEVDELETVWPWVKDDDFCSRHQRKPRSL